MTQTFPADPGHTYYRYGNVPVLNPTFDTLGGEYFVRNARNGIAYTDSTMTTAAIVRNGAGMLLPTLSTNSAGAVEDYWVRDNPDAVFVVWPGVGQSITQTCTEAGGVGAAATQAAADAQAAKDAVLQVQADVTAQLADAVGLPFISLPPGAPSVADEYPAEWTSGQRLLVHVPPAPGTTPSNGDAVTAVTVADTVASFTVHGIATPVQIATKAATDAIKTTADTALARTVETYRNVGDATGTLTISNALQTTTVKANLTGDLAGITLSGLPADTSQPWDLTLLLSNSARYQVKFPAGWNWPAADAAPRMPLGSGATMAIQLRGNWRGPNIIDAWVVAPQFSPKTWDDAVLALQPVAAYFFHGGAAVDSVGGPPAVLTGSPVLTNPAILGSGTGLTLDGVNDWAEVTTGRVVSLTRPWSILVAHSSAAGTTAARKLYAETGGSSTNGAVFSLGTASASPYNTYRIFWRPDNTTAGIAATADASVGFDGASRQVAVTFDGANLRLYKGSPTPVVYPVTVPTGATYTPDIAAAGALVTRTDATPASQFAAGKLALATFGRCLTDDEVHYLLAVA